MSALVEEHDCLLLDLDGTVFRGQEPTPGSVETLATVRARTLYVTNNASREPAPFDPDSPWWLASNARSFAEVVAEAEFDRTVWATLCGDVPSPSGGHAG